jgi:hypothetical protein
MAICSVADVRAKIYSASLSDAEITALITEVSEDVLTLCNTSVDTHTTVILAGKYAILAAVLRRMKTTGEMAANVQTPEYRQQNTIDLDIERYEQKSAALIAQYNASSAYVFTSPSFRRGFGHHSHGGHHG